MEDELAWLLQELSRVRPCLRPLELPEKTAEALVAPTEAMVPTEALPREAAFAGCMPLTPRRSKGVAMVTPERVVTPDRSDKDDRADNDEGVDDDDDDDDRADEDERADKDVSEARAYEMPFGGSLFPAGARAKVVGVVDLKWFSVIHAEAIGHDDSFVAPTFEFEVSIERVELLFVDTLIGGILKSPRLGVLRETGHITAGDLLSRVDGHVLNLQEGLDSLISQLSSARHSLTFGRYLEGRDLLQNAFGAWAELVKQNLRARRQFLRLATLRKKALEDVLFRKLLRLSWDRWAKEAAMAKLLKNFLRRNLKRRAFWNLEAFAQQKTLHAAFKEWRNDFLERKKLLLARCFAAWVQQTALSKKILIFLRMNLKRRAFATWNVFAQQKTLRAEALVQWRDDFLEQQRRKKQKLLVFARCFRARRQSSPGRIESSAFYAWRSVAFERSRILTRTTILRALVGRLCRVEVERCLDAWRRATSNLRSASTLQRRACEKVVFRLPTRKAFAQWRTQIFASQKIRETQRHYFEKWRHYCRELRRNIKAQTFRIWQSQVRKKKTLHFLSKRHERKRLEKSWRVFKTQTEKEAVAEERVQHDLLNRFFRRWERRALASSQKAHFLRRLVVASSKRQKQQAFKKLTGRSPFLVTKAWRSWLWKTKQRQSCRQLLIRVFSAFLRKKTASAFKKWAATKTQNALTKRLVFFAWKLEVSMTQTVGLCRSVVLRAILRKWRSKRLSTAMQKWSHLTRRSSAVAKAFRTWRKVTAFSLELDLQRRSILRKLISRFTLTSSARALHKWMAYQPLTLWSRPSPPPSPTTTKQTKTRDLNCSPISKGSPPLDNKLQEGSSLNKLQALHRGVSARRSTRIVRVPSSYSSASPTWRPPCVWLSNPGMGTL